ncbi:MAG: SO_0444 family Cu/Zn efflux transporter [Ferrimonas sp.]
MTTLYHLGANFLDLFLDSAPWLLLGLFMAGMIKMFVPMSWMERQLGGNGMKPVIKAALFGAPLPLCSCGVIPAAVGLRRSGASKSATTSFLVATPETGVDSVSVSYVLLGPFMAVVRPIAAITSAIVAGLLVGRDDTPPSSKPASSTQASGCCSTPKKPQSSSCCGSKKSSISLQPMSANPMILQQPITRSRTTATKASQTQASDAGCCGGHAPTPATHSKITEKLWAGIVYASTDLVKDTTLWLLVGLFFAALVNTFIPASFLAQWGGGVLAMVVMVLVSIPMYICATASTPIAAGLLLAGVSPGAVLVFMMAGPATNIATLGVVRNELGKRALSAYLFGVIGTAMLFGFGVDWAVQEFGLSVMPLVGEEHRMLPSLLTYGCGVLLALLMANVLWQQYVSRRLVTA